ncbi:MAG: hydrogenase maturation nickel metallochaperone HypA [Acidimicrobiia bacterium]|nr:hydrogenase maturation nickel metallochaperone HypA [Acidimicrobiia bacterium]
MHEVSIAQAVLAEVTASAESHGVDRVGRITLRIGRLSGVVESALRFGFELVAENSVAEGAELVVENEPVVVRCPAGGHSLELDDVHFYCDEHQVACPELLSGRQLEIVSYDPVPVSAPREVR